MSNELDLYSNGGGLQPYHGGEVAPAPDWGAPDLLRDSTETYTGGGQYILGQPLPPGVSIKEVTEGYKALGNVFAQDFMRLGHNITNTQKAVAWFMAALKNPPAQQQKRHSYNLYEHTNDPIFQAFANYAQDNKFSAKFVSDACWWVTEASKRLNAQQFGTQPAHGSAPDSETPLANLSEAQFQQVEAHNQNVTAQSMGILEAKWGQCFVENLKVAKRYLYSLPADQQAYFHQMTGSFPYTAMLSTVEAWIFLFDAAIGAHSISNITQEIAQFEAMLKIPSEREKYMRDPAMQARLRELYRRRG